MSKLILKTSDLRLCRKGKIHFLCIDGIKADEIRMLWLDYWRRINVTRATSIDVDIGYYSHNQLNLARLVMLHAFCEDNDIEFVEDKVIEIV